MREDSPVTIIEDITPHMFILHGRKGDIIMVRKDKLEEYREYKKLLELYDRERQKGICS